MALIFVRHGSTELNAGDPKDKKDYFRGWTDAPLSDFGRKTVKQTAAWFKPLKIDKLYTSDLPRAVETAQMISKVTNNKVEPDKRLRPLDVGYLTAQLITPEGKKVLEESHRNKDEPIPGGESYNDFIDRYTDILPDLLKESKDKNVVVVTHHRNLLALPHLFFGKPLKVKGPPEPGGIMTLTDKGIHVLYVPPAVASVYNEHASS